MGQKHLMINRGKYILGTKNLLRRLDRISQPYSQIGGSAHKKIELLKKSIRGSLPLTFKLKLKNR
jgi:hypothetical protein